MIDRKTAEAMAGVHMEYARAATLPGVRELHQAAAVVLDEYAKTGKGEEEARARSADAFRVNEDVRRQLRRGARMVQLVSLIREDASLAQQQLSTTPTNPLSVAFARADAALAQLMALHEADERNVLNLGDLDHAHHLTSVQRTYFSTQDAEEAADVIEGYVREAEFWLAPRGGEG